MEKNLTQTSAATAVETPPCRVSRACAAAIKRHRGAIARTLAENLRIIPRWSDEIERNRHDIDGFIERELNVFVDYVYNYMFTGNEAYANLYIGEKLKLTYDAALPPEQAAQLRKQLGDLDAGVFLDVLGGALARQHLEYLERHLSRLHAVVAGTGQKTLNVLFVQDCLYLDVLAFLTGPLLADGIGLNPFYATSKNPAELRAQIGEASRNRIHAVFFSPFTYEFSPEFAQLLRWNNSLMRPADARKLAGRVLVETERTLDMLASVFDCHVFVHNTAMLIRDPSPVKRRIKNIATMRPRRAARGFVNQWLSDYVQRKNAETFDHLFLVDETDPMRRLGENALGAMFYSAALQHPAAFGREIAGRYRDLLFVEGHLLKKKLVVCDLDNTLWEGVIGEGAVRHYDDRQKVLKKLREKGVVLAVNSKNDPANVHWTGCALSEDDFVCREISWEPKVNGMRRIQGALNLKLKDYVFIDDRADEREMVKKAFHEVFTMDATDPRTWELLSLWAALLETNPEMDRTLLYRQREERQKFLGLEEEAARDTAAMFADLDLRVHIRPAARGDLKRVVELINRTNQFNLAASRASYAEAADWSKDAGANLLVAHAADRFGDMGLVCAALARTTGNGLEISVFVLSCRVFGYGIENAVMNYIKKAADGKQIKGWYRETQQNGPCKNFYAENEFSLDNGAWVFRGAARENPAWLTVTTD